MLNMHKNHEGFVHRYITCCTEHLVLKTVLTFRAGSKSNQVEGRLLPRARPFAEPVWDNIRKRPFSSGIQPNVRGTKSLIGIDCLLLVACPTPKTCNFASLLMWLLFQCGNDELYASAKYPAMASPKTSLLSFYYFLTGFFSI